MTIQNTKQKSFFSSPARVIVFSFAAVILSGAVLLSLPISSKSGSFTPFMDSLFTATSATCVTGLIIYDTFTHWSIFGQLVILLMIQTGGLGLITFTTFFNVIAGKKLGLRGMQLAQESINMMSIADINKLVKNVVLIAMIVESTGAILLATRFVPRYGISGIYISIFLAVSAFCNAGFDILGREGAFMSLSNYNGDFVVLVTIALLIIIGGLGFIVWNDLISYRQSKKLMLHTKIVLIVSGVLIVFGMFVFLLFEWNNPETFAPLNFFEKINAAFFQSVTTRTAGFNSVDIAALTDSTKVFSILLMFIGASPGSTGGGVKVTTIAVIVMTVICVARGREDTQIAKRKIDKSIVYKSLAIVSISLLCVALCSGITLFTMHSVHQVSGIDVVFESVSAFATVGLSDGVTAIANLPSRAMLMFSMFLGRVGPVSLALSLTLRAQSSKKSIVPEGKIIVG